MHLGADESTCLQPDSPANPFPWPEAERERTTTVTSGRKLSEQYVKSGQLGSLARTLLESSRWFSPARRLKWEAAPLSSEKITELERSSAKSTSSKPSAATLSEKVIPSNRLLFRLVPSERPTAGTASGLLPTVQTDGISFHPPGKGQQYMRGKALQKAVQTGLLPTPMSTEVRHEQRVKELKESGKTSFRSREKGESGANGLMDYMDFHGMLPTPAAQDGKNSTIPKSQTKRHQLPGVIGKNCPPSDGQDSPQLNPLFVEEMMGFPEDWLVSPFLSGEQNP